MTFRFAYNDTGVGVTVITAAPRESLESVLGPLTDVEYRMHVLVRNKRGPNDVLELPEDWEAPPDWNHGVGWIIRDGKIERS